MRLTDQLTCRDQNLGGKHTGTHALGTNAQDEASDKAAAAASARDQASWRDHSTPGYSPVPLLWKRKEMYRCLTWGVTSTEVVLVA